MQITKDQLTKRLVDLVERISAQMRPESDEEWSDLELTMPQFRAICLLGQGPERMGNLAGHLNTSMSSATSMIDRLVDKGLVERAPDASDRRVVTCQLTSRGREEMERFLRINQLRLTRMAGRLTIEELQTVVDAMDILCSAAQRGCPTQMP